MTQRKGLRGILALLCAMTLLIGAIGPAWATEAAAPESAPTAAAPENTPAPSAETPKAVITSWQWVDPNGYLNAGVLQLSETQVDYNGVTSFLPGTIIAQVEGQTAPVTVNVVNWHCPEFSGLVSSGEFTFKAEIAPDYTLGENAPTLEVKVKFQQPVTNAPVDTTGDTTAPTDTTGNTPAPAAPTPPASEDVPAPKCSCEIRCAQDAVKADCPVCSAEGAKLDTVCTGAAPQPLPELPQELANGMTLWVGNQNITTDGYWTTDSTGKLTAATADSWNVHYDTESNTLTLNGANIVGTFDTICNPTAAGISATSASAAVDFTIKLEGNSTVSGESAIYIKSNTASANLTISGRSSINLIGSSADNRAISVFSAGADPLNLNILDADVTVSGGRESADVIQLAGGEYSTANITVDGGNLDAKGGIFYAFAGEHGGTAQLTINDGAVVRAVRGITSTSGSVKYTPSKDSGGIVFDGRYGTVYGNVTLDEEFNIGDGESLTIPDGAALTNNGTLTNKGTVSVEGSGSLTNNGTINNSGTLPENVEGTVNQAPKITTASLPDGTVGTAYEQTLEATGDAAITWSVTSGSLPTGLNLNGDTGVISGTPTAAGSSKFTVTATNNGGSDSKEFIINIPQPSDTTPPTLTAGAVTRTSDTEATVTFTSDEAGTYFYEVVESGAGVPNIDASGNGTACVNGENVITLTSLKVGAKDIYIVTKDMAGNESSMLKMTIPAYTPPAVSVSITFQNYTGKTYDGKAMANPTKDQLTVTGADFSEVTFTWYKDAAVEENKLTSAPTDAGTYILVAAVAKTDSHGEASAQKGITITKADATDAMKKAEGTMIKNHESSLTLPTLPDGASYGTPTGNGTYVTDLRVSDGKLAYKGTSNVVNDGKYEVKVPVTGAKNYKEYSIVVTLTGEEKLPVTLTAAKFTTTYNGSEVFPEAIHKTATCDGHAVSGTWSFVKGNPKNAGTYKDIELKFTPKDKDKYAEASIKLDVVIKKAPLKVSVKLSKTKIAVNSKLPTVSLSYIGLVGNEKLDPDVEPKFEGMPSGKKTGTYTIKLKNVDEVKEAIEALSASENYDITYVTSAKLSVVSGNNPLTADTSNIGMWTAIMIISGIGLIVVLVVMVVLNKKSKRRRPRYRRTPPRHED